MVKDFHTRFDGAQTMWSISSPLQGLVGAGLADMTRPAEKLSTSQSAVLTATGEMK